MKSQKRVSADLRVKFVFPSVFYADGNLLVIEHCLSIVSLALVYADRNILFDYSSVLIPAVYSYCVIYCISECNINCCRVGIICLLIPLLSILVIIPYCILLCAATAC